MQGQNALVANRLFNFASCLLAEGTAASIEERGLAIAGEAAKLSRRANKGLMRELECLVVLASMNEILGKQVMRAPCSLRTASRL